MESSKLRSTNLSIFGDSRMRRSTHTGNFPVATFPGEVTHLDVIASGKDNQPVGLSGERTSVRLAVLFVDGYSHFKAVYFCNTEKQVPNLTAFYLAELGRAHFCGGHFVLEDGATRHIPRTAAAPSSAGPQSPPLESIEPPAAPSCAGPQRTAAAPSSAGPQPPPLESIEPAAPLPSAASPRNAKVPLPSNRGTTPDVRAALKVAGLQHKYWNWALRHRVHSRNKLATRPVINATTGLTECV